MDNRKLYSLLRCDRRKRLNNKKINLIDWRTQQQRRQQITGLMLLIIGTVIIISSLAVLHYQLVQTTQLQLSHLSSTHTKHCNTQQTNTLQHQLQHIQRYKKWWQHVEHCHNQRSTVLGFIAQHVSIALSFTRVAFLDHQWLLEGKARSAYLYQQLLQQLNHAALDHSFTLGEISHNASGFYRFSLIGKPRENISMATATTATE